MYESPHDPLSLQLLGPLALTGPEAPRAQLLLCQPKRTALLVYALVQAGGAFVTRDALLSVFWPESDTERARNALRQSLAFIRSSLGSDVIETRGRQSVGVCGARLTCDALRFEKLIEAGASADALSLYRGDFLSGFHVDGSRAFADWVDRRRDRLREGAAGAAWCLAYSSASDGLAPAASFWGKRALELSPFRETEVQRLIELLDRVGDRGGALRAYRGLEAHLRAEYESEPSPETKRLVARVRSRTEAGSDPTPLHTQARRGGLDRRGLSDRRRGQLEFEHPERRITRRRKSARRTGHDRRNPPPFPGEGSGLVT